MEEPRSRAADLLGVNGHQELIHLGHEELTHPGGPAGVAFTS